MKTFDVVKSYFRTSGINSYQSTQWHLFNTKNVLFILMLGINLASTCFYSLQEAKKFEDYVDSYFWITTTFAHGLTFVIIIWKLPPLYRFFMDLENIIKNRLKHTKSRKLYNKTDDKVAKWIKVLDFYSVKATPIFVVTPKLITSFVLYYTTDAGREAFELAIPKWYPFDWKNPMGYLAVVIIQYIVTLIIQCGMMRLLTFQIETLLMVISMTKDIKYSLHSINRKAKANRTEIVKEFTDIIQFHSNAKQLINYFSKQSKSLFLIIFVWSLSSIAVSMLLIEMELMQNANHSMILVNLISQMFWSFSLVFLVSDFGHKVTAAFEEIDNTFDQINWYLFPYKMWKLLPMIVAAAQQPAELAVFGRISCSREDFKNVAHRGYSYFMVLRQFGLR